MKYLDKLIALHQEAYDETFRWEVRHARMGRVNRMLLVFAVIAAFYNLAVLVIFGLAVHRIILVVTAVALVVFVVWLLQKHAAHVQWIVDTRADWEVDLRHWQAVRMELEETGSVPGWASPPPSAVDNS